MVLEYRDARDAYEAILEDQTSMYATEVAEYKRDHPGPTFKAWLQGQAKPREEEESYDDETDQVA